jgi:hypothetical protein
MNVQDNSVKAAGIILIVSALLAILLMAHHPTIGASGFESTVEELHAESGINQFVHGGMILIVLIWYFTLAVFSEKLGRTKASVIAGKTAFAAATAMMIGAAIVSGFLVPGFAEHFAEESKDEAAFFAAMILMHEANQVLAIGGTIAYGGAMAFWSAGLLRIKGLARIAGAYGLAAGAVIVFLMLADMLTLNVTGMGAVVAALGVWMILVAVIMLRKPD